MKKTMGLIIRTLCAVLAVCLLAGGLVACAGSSEIPEGYQYATCNGEYFRLFVPTQWTVNTQSGVSSAFYHSEDPVTVTMTEVPFALPEADTSENTAETEIPKGAELVDFFEAHEREISKMKGYTHDKTFEKTTLAGYRAMEIQYFIIQGETEMKIRQVLTKVGGRFFLFTYSAKKDSFDQWMDIVDGILENITFESYPYGGDEAPEAGEENTPDSMKLISDDEVAYRFYVPSGWIKETNVGQNLAYASKTDRSNVSVISYAPENDAMTVEEYWALCREEYEKSLENFVLLSEAESAMGGKFALVVEYTYTLGGVDYSVRQVIAKYSAMMYTMTYTALPENYETHLSQAVAMQEALTFRKIFG